MIENKVEIFMNINLPNEMLTPFRGELRKILITQHGITLIDIKHGCNGLILLCDKIISGNALEAVTNKMKDYIKCRNN